MIAQFYRSRFLLPVIVLLLGVASIPSTSQAAIIAGEDPGDRMRFSSPGVVNPNFVLGGFDVSGIGVAGVDNDGGITRGTTLITPRHYVTAAHFPTDTARFRGADGVVREYATTGSPTSLTTFNNGSASESDLLLYTLIDPIPESDGVTPLAVLDAETQSQFNSIIGREIFAYDQFDRVGRNVIDNVVIAVSDSGPPRPTFSVLYSFDTAENGGLSDEARLEANDSGRPALIDIDGTLTLVGTHLGIDNSDGQFLSFSTLIIPYLDQIEETTLAQGGFSLNRVTITSIATVPEPTAGLVIGVIGICGAMKRRRRRIR